MKRKKKFTERVELRISPDELMEIDREAERLGIPRAQLVRNLLNNGLDDLRLMRKLGIISLIEFIRVNKINPTKVIELAIEKK